MTGMKTRGMLMGLLGMAAAMSAPLHGTGSVEVNGNFSGSGTPANLKKNRKKPVTMRKPKSKKR